MAVSPTMGKWQYIWQKQSKKNGCSKNYKKVKRRLLWERARLSRSLQSCYTQGDTYEEALENIQDAIKLHLEDRLAEQEEISEPQSVSLAMIEVAA